MDRTEGGLYRCGLWTYGVKGVYIHCGLQNGTATACDCHKCAWYMTTVIVIDVVLLAANHHTLYVLHATPDTAVAPCQHNPLIYAQDCGVGLCYG